MLLLKICIGDWMNASRDKRELSVCEELQLSTAVLAKGDVADKGRTERIDGFQVYRYSSRPLGEHVPNTLNRFIALFTWAGYVRRKIKPDIISGHDLPGLLIGWMSNWFRGKNKAKLVYDSHEFALGLEKNRSFLKYRTVRKLEKVLIRKSELVLMVSDSIADEVTRIHHLSKKPTVVRNVPNMWKPDIEKALQIRSRLLNGVSFTGDPFVVMYHGGLSEGRGIEPLISAVARVSDTVLVVLGSGRIDYVERLKKMASSVGVKDRVLFHEAVSLQELPEYVSAADIGVSILMPTAVNHYYALPNKFFENIQCLNPLIVSDFPEMGKLVDQYSIGIKVDPTNSDSIADAIRVFMNDSDFLGRCKKNLLRAKQDLCWENEKEILRVAYEEVIEAIR